jgi:hypothetical protein
MISAIAPTGATRSFEMGDKSPKGNAKQNKQKAAHKAAKKAKGAPAPAAAGAPKPR